MSDKWHIFNLTWADIAFDQMPKVVMERVEKADPSPVYAAWERVPLVSIEVAPAMMSANDILFGTIEKT